jgi:hypothetical protein
LKGDELDSESGYQVKDLKDGDSEPEYHVESSGEWAARRLYTQST